MNISDRSKIFILILFTVISGFVIQSMFSIMVITGDSMHPELHHQDIVVLKDNPASVTNGDVIAVPSGRGFVMVHKVVKTTNSTVQTKGVNNSYLDPPKTREKIKGKVIYSISPPDIIKQTIIEILYPSTYEELEKSSDLKQY